MSKDLKITPRSEDFSQWYNDIIAKADMAEHSPVKGCMIIKPYGYAIWELMQAALDKMIKERGVQNAYFPIFIPKKFLEREKEHVEGFSPELAVVTHGGGQKLDEPLVVRPTSETIMYDTFSRWINSYRDLPLLINQWANVVRWEKRTRLFLRTTEFLWQEGHTAHTTSAEAQESTLNFLDMYERFTRDFMAMPTVKGDKPQFDKFAGAVNTYSIEAIMQDGKALQSGTSHNLGTNFASVFNIQYLDKNNKQQLVYQSSWGVSTRLIGALIMTHSDDQGLRLPPAIAPIQVVIVPIYKSPEDKKAVMDIVRQMLESFARQNIRFKVDDDENKSPGWKFNEWEQKGVPVRIEVGPKDIAKGEVPVFRRDTGEKENIAIDALPQKIAKLLTNIQDGLLKQAEKFLQENSYHTDDWEKFKTIMTENPGFVFSHWCGEEQCAEQIKEITKATLRNIPFDSKVASGKCIKCGKDSKQEVLFARSY